MNIIKQRQEDRLEKLKVITESIKKAKDPDYDLLVMKCCSDWGITERTAKELIKVARFRIEHESS
tara:strand:- start:1042 stop:1236 length:195 start_codon:yes stop_codon:yes gene_type:complete